MKRLLSLLAVLALGIAFAVPAFADGRVRLGVSIGVPLGAPYGPPYYPGPYYAYPPYYANPYYDYPPRVVVVPSSPPTYIERGQEAGAEAPSNAYWYYCAESKAYYPYVKHCPGGWQRVAPQPPQPPQPPQ